MDQYSIDTFICPGTTPNTQIFINQFIAAKYGLFTCFDSVQSWGSNPIDHELLQTWEKPKKLKRTWNFAVMSAVFNNQLTWEELEPYRKNHHKKIKKQSKSRQ